MIYAVMQLNKIISDKFYCCYSLTLIMATSEIIVICKLRVYYNFYIKNTVIVQYSVR